MSVDIKFPGLGIKRFKLYEIKTYKKTRYFYYFLVFEDYFRVYHVLLKNKFGRSFYE